MTDLDEQFLKKNVPNKFRQWDQYEESFEKKQVDFDQYDVSNLMKSLPPLPITETKYRNNTGVKGVIADYNDAMQVEATQQLAKKEEREEWLRRATTGVILESEEVSVSLSAIEYQKGQEKSQRCAEDSDSDNFDFEDEEVLKIYRKSRMQRMQECRTWPDFGTMKNICIEEFSSVIDESDPRVFCVFHLYEDGITSCDLLNEYLTVLARNMNYCRFCQMKISEAKQNFDPVGLPCVLIYRGGKEVANLTPITKHIPSWTYGSRFTMHDIEYVLRLFGVINPNITTNSI